MPLVKIFALPTIKKLPLPALQSALCKVWGTKPNTTKLMVCHVDDWTDSGGEDLFVDVRAKATPERTRDAVLEKMGEVQQVFAEHGYKANVRLETYAADSYFHKLP
mmetsp:Transcript_64699/g.159230  ORF Transcript_64699/g.159230 Transcript_64699/m.159230 type:complete len:106 (+) Transcript_64699:187-504(+)|eukprot:CAMPEP_0206221252 /NCGR_PEP_ID=MMETSP0047_2-20121206/5310_1 /ASSEMBLY_ACC=CAM_ASM_000192 /TAXON_ID=195065 /ORGANISM="Chroomonas mesostigmatica_cf, Strain CCMP1168" /LENGTH=105 /DNA_ID=CAMNT_0053643963 /DNA_START=172 /DNA_END=489 /DNA_ORIENTATION=+